ncbi:MAG: sortase [Aggregatilineales bacterium]
MTYRRRRRTIFPWWQTLLLIGAVVIIFAISQNVNIPKNAASGRVMGAPTLPDHLTRADVLPTLTPDTRAPLRRIIFPATGTIAPIVEAMRAGDSWEMRYLGNSVGHLAGTSWLDDPGGNIALAGHIEDAQGEPGPFAHLSQAKIGDVVILQEGQRLIYYRVTTVVRAASDDIRYVSQDGHHRVTLITCADWDASTARYLSRLVVVAVPVNI